ncbi:glycosyltransferase [Nocardioides acrostichi]|uniref:Glycosyltransferase n=1 Tax=Nocardioides acrostichi TaxID=2784339 RepID=A0A930V0G6_9ACTN|nr:glycosyltransferase [Nocardioides acrostichi]MBF4161759.1 glycosyltransferase [Nocardioides acrostichi]
MRVQIVTESFYPAVDGSTTTVRNVADQLIDAGHEVALVAPAPGLGRYRASRVTRVSPLAKPGAQVRAAIDAFAPDALLCVSPSHAPAGLGRRALKHAAHAGVRSVLLQTSPVADLAWDYWRAKVADRADEVVVTAQWLADAMAAKGVEAQVWRPGVDIRAFDPGLRDPWLHRHWSRGERGKPAVVVGFVGSLRRRHGVRDLAALADVTGIRLVIMGAGPQRDWLAVRLPGAKVTGTLGTSDLTVALASLDLLVHPGRTETCCHALREAGASGVPVVAPRAGGAPETVRHLESGLLYDPAEPRGLADAVRALAADRHRSLLGAHGREAAAGRTWTAAVEDLWPVLAPRQGAAAR